ncbi:hypothetical protein [uncultured Phascolarctobacterium sp.]
MKPDIKKIVITNLPYLLFVYLFGKLSQAWRLACRFRANPPVFSVPA